MDIIQNIIVTMLGTILLGLIVSWFLRMVDLQENLWIEPVVMAFVVLLIYLVVR